MATNVVDSIPETLRALLKQFERSPGDLASVARMSAKGLGLNLDAWHRLRAVVDGAIVQLQGEVNRRELFREDGAPCSRDWQVARFGVSNATARTYDQVAEKAMDLPVLTRALSTGEIGLDKMRLAAAVATPETDRELADTARRCTVHELGQLLRARQRPTATNDQAAYEARSLRFNDPCRTMSVHLPAEDYAATKACIQAQAKAIQSDGEIGWDQRCCDAFLGLIRSVGGLGGSARAELQPRQLKGSREARTKSVSGATKREAESSRFSAHISPYSTHRCRHWSTRRAHRPIWPATSSKVDSSVSRPCVGCSATAPSSSLWTTIRDTRCTRDGNVVAPPGPSGGRSGGGIDVAGSPVAKTRPSPNRITSIGGSNAGPRTCQTSPCCAVTITISSIERDGRCVGTRTPS